MAKEVTVLGLEGDGLKGLRLDGDDASYARGDVASWAFAVDEPDAGEPSAADAAAEAVAAADAAPETEEESPLVGAFAAAAETFGTREVSLSLPLSMLLVRTVRLPIEERDNLADAALAALKEVSPFPDESLTPGVEVVAETDSEILAVVAALPDAAAEEVSGALDAAKVHVVRTDATAFGWLRGLWPRICERQDVSRRLVLMDLGAGWDFVLLVDGAPVYLRGIGFVESVAELGREVMLGLLQAEGGDDGVDEVVVCSQGPVDEAVLARLAQFGEVRTVLAEDEYLGVEGSARRVVEGASLDVTPAAWREARTEARFTRTLMRTLAVVGGLWLLLMAVLFGVDAVYAFRTKRVNGARTEKVHQKAVKEVVAMTNSVALIERYRDHAHGALEILKTVSDLLPDDDGMTWTKFAYTRGASVRVTGFAQERDHNRDYLDVLKNAAFDDEERLFDSVKSASSDKKTKKGYPLDIECFFPTGDDDGKKGGSR